MAAARHLQSAMLESVSPMQPDRYYLLLSFTYYYYYLYISIIYYFMIKKIVKETTMHYLKYPCPDSVPVL